MMDGRVKDVLDAYKAGPLCSRGSNSGLLFLGDR